MIDGASIAYKTTRIYASKNMPAFWMTFKPYGPKSPDGWPIEELRMVIDRFREDRNGLHEWWRLKAHTLAKPGDQLWFFQQGSGRRGIFGVGEMIGRPEFRNSINNSDIDAWRAPVRFKYLVDPSANLLIDYDETRDIIPDALAGRQSSGQTLTDSIAEKLQDILDTQVNSWFIIDDNSADNGSFDPESFEKPERTSRTIIARRGQTAFRNALLEAYGGRCVMTGCAILPILEAAHISPYAKTAVNHTANGLLLRSDVHTLFDCGWISVAPETRKIVICSSLNGSSYRSLEGRAIRSPANPRLGPSKVALSKHYGAFQNRWGMS